MNANGQRLLNHHSTAGAILRCVARFDKYDDTTSILSFVRSVLYQLSPSGTLLSPASRIIALPIVVYFAEDMNMIKHHFQFQDFSTQLLRNLIDDFSQLLIHATHKHFVAIFRIKDNMILAGINDMTAAFIDHVFYYTIMPYLLSRLALYPHC